MALVDEYILGNPALDAQFSIATRILSEVLAGAPSPVTITQLVQRTGQPARELEKMCAALVAGRLIQPDANGAGWLLACEPNRTTLEDVFRCVLTGQGGTGRTLSKPVAPGDQIRRDIGLLIMQVTMAINQSVYKYLRQFPVARLSGGGGSFVDSRLSARPSRYDDADLT